MFDQALGCGALPPTLLLRPVTVLIYLPLRVHYHLGAYQRCAALDVLVECASDAQSSATLWTSVLGRSTVLCHMTLKIRGRRARMGAHWTDLKRQYYDELVVYSAKYIHRELHGSCTRRVACRAQ